jgi:methionyl-tRNA formyltransferase
MKEAPQIIFLGTPEFAVPSLEILVRNGYAVAAVVTAPDQPAGRGQVMTSSPVKKFAESLDIPVLQPDKLKNPDFLATLNAFNASLFIVVAFRMLPEAVWKMPSLGTFNLHASLLPQYRGAAPINHAIINGETETGLTTFFLKQEIDTGEIIFQERITILPGENAGELHDRMMAAGADLVLKTTRAIFSGSIRPFDQQQLIDFSIPLKPAPKIFRENCLIDWSKTSDDIYNLIRGLSPYPTAFTFFTSPAGEKYAVKIYRGEKSYRKRDMQASTLVTDGKKSLSVVTSDGTIDILELQLAGKKTMKTEEFLRGFRIFSDWKVG